MQIAKFALATYYNERLGWIQFQTYAISQQITNSNTACKAKIQIVGHQQIFFSTQMIQKEDFDYIRYSQLIPWHDGKGEIKGCQLIWYSETQGKSFENSVINLLDQDVNNIYDYQSQIVSVG